MRNLLGFSILYLVCSLLLLRRLVAEIGARPLKECWLLRLQVEGSLV